MINGTKVVILFEVPENAPYIFGDVAVEIIKSGTCKGG